MHIIFRIGDWYHKWIYRFLAWLTSRFTDLTDYALTDLLLWAALFVYEIAFVAIIFTWHSGASLADLYKVLIFVGVAMLLYGFNAFRTPVEEKMGLVIQANLDRNEELGYVIRRLNGLSGSAKLSFKEANERMNKSLDEFSEEVDGYQIVHSKKTKMSLFSKLLLRRRILGLMNPFFQEIIVTSDLFLDAIAHEKAHLVGYAKEAEAQFVGYAFMLNGGEPLQYLAYLQRIDMLMIMFDLDTADVGRMGLNKRTIDELSSRDAIMRNECGRNSYYRKFLVSIGKRIRSAMLIVFGEGDIENAYVKDPLLMISAYDPPK